MFLLGLLLSASLQMAHAEPLQDYFNTVVAEVQTKLPPSVRKSLAGKIKVRIGKLNSKAPSLQLTCMEPSLDGSQPAQTSTIQGVYRKKQNLIEIDQFLVNQAAQNTLCPESQTPVRYFLEQAILHEMAHAYDFLPYADSRGKKLAQHCKTELMEKMHSGRSSTTRLEAYQKLEKKCQVYFKTQEKSLVSDSYIFEEIINYKGSPKSGEFLNENPERVLMSYEYTNSAEFLAVNFARWILDPEYSCRRPRVEAFFKERFDYDPYPQKSCETNYKFVLSNGQVKDINPANVYRIDYLLAAPGKGIQSQFGHVMFRVVVCAPERIDPILKTTIPATPMGPDCVKDEKYHLILSFFGGVTDIKIDYLKGFLGGYPSYLMAHDFTKKVDEYTRYEFRDLTAYPILFSEEQKNLFLKSAVEVFWQYSGDYRFINRNCATEALRLVRSSVGNVDLNHWDFLNDKSLFPFGVLEVLQNNKLAAKKSKDLIVYKSKKDLFNTAFKEARAVYPSASKLGMKFFDEVSTDERSHSLEKLDTLNLDKKALSALLVIEQHARNLMAMYLSRLITTYLYEQKDKNPAYAEEIERTLDHTYTRHFANKGFGVPYWIEVEQELHKIEERNASRDAVRKEDQDIQEKFAPELAELAQIDENLLKVRTAFKKLVIKPTP